jgi:hypothetical protein
MSEVFYLQAVVTAPEPLHYIDDIDDHEGRKEYGKQRYALPLGKVRGGLADFTGTFFFYLRHALAHSGEQSFIVHIF